MEAEIGTRFERELGNKTIICTITATHAKKGIQYKDEKGFLGWCSWWYWSKYHSKRIV